jgi:DEAD/DEAH box helicase
MIDNSSIPQLFHTLTTHQPYNFQTQTINRILNRQDTILRAPTGSGKTETAIADSWRCMIHFLPDVLPLSQPNLSRNVYKLSELDLEQFFGRDEVEFLQLYSLVVRALRLCDQRSVQLI